MPRGGAEQREDGGGGGVVRVVKLGISQGGRERQKWISGAVDLRVDLAAGHRYSHSRYTLLACHRRVACSAQMRGGGSLAVFLATAISLT